MSDLFAVGTDKNEPFCVTLDAEHVEKLISMAMHGEDNLLEEELKAMVDTERKVVDAMCWESDDFTEDMRSILRYHGRFAIKHKDLMFGVSQDWDLAKTAFENKEF